ncbi:NAD(P)-binding protein [Crucibulum laeve]|uniref:NAD(P)-binding protein n=1 Tax=Crucibulum laeve TaxID=68775 RepID=A0A5C3M685_9AGAR|nr:NAD(P)-binding protein [Crucibulum laeve]
MGATLSLMGQVFPPASKFSVNDIPDLTGRVIIVTGANTGLGKETAKALLVHNAKVYIAARSKDKAEQAIQDLKQETGKQAHFLKLDLADLKSVKAAAEEFHSKETQLHILFNNGGVMVPPVKDVTAQGYDLQFGTNVLGHFYFTKLLLPTLLATAKTSPDGTARVVSTASSAEVFLSTIDFNSLKDGPARRNKYSSTLYAQSKFGNVVLSNELARRYGSEGLVSTAINPGNLQSDLQRHLSFFEWLFIRPILYPTPFGALNQLYAGTTAPGKEVNGKYVVPWARVIETSAPTKDPKIGQELWKWMEEQVENV